VCVCVCVCVTVALAVASCYCTLCFKKMRLTLDIVSSVHIRRFR